MLSIFEEYIPWPESLCILFGKPWIALYMQLVALDVANHLKLSETVVDYTQYMVRATRWLSTPLKHPCHLTAYYKTGIAIHNL